MLITLITGFLGSGKTTLIRRLLHARQDEERCAVIVNDIADLMVDGDLIANAHHVSEAAGTLINISGGSIDDIHLGTMQDAVTALAGQGIDRLIIETSGATNPTPVLAALMAFPLVRLGSVITLVDARAWAMDYGFGAGAEGLEHAETLLKRQISAASVVALTKLDLLPPEMIDGIVQSIVSLNPAATVVECLHGAWPHDKYLDTPPTVLEHHQAAAPIEGEPLSTRTVIDPRPLHPTRFHELFTTNLGARILRSKGFIWLASRPDHVLGWHQAGGAMGLELLALWKAAILNDRQLLPEELTGLRADLATAHPVFGDRRCELVLIGMEPDLSLFTEHLMACFCTDTEITQWQDHREFTDPWPSRLRSA